MWRVVCTSSTSTLDTKTRVQVSRTYTSARAYRMSRQVAVVYTIIVPAEEQHASEQPT